MAALKYWLWLTTAPALSNRAKLLLLEHFSSPEDVYYAQPDQLCLVEGITRQQAESLSDKSLARAEKVLADCARDGQFIVTMDDAAYPARLRDMYDPPVLLYGKGSMPLFDEEAAVAVVGTRKCSPYGTRAASQLGYELARQGGLVISGLAKGIDGAAHQGALRAGGFTAAVLGGGADVIYTATGWPGHTAFIDPRSEEFKAASMEEFLQLGSRITTEVPLTVCENSLFGPMGASGDVWAVPPKSATIGPRDVMHAKEVVELHNFANADGSSWQRMVSRLELYGPISMECPASIYRLKKGVCYVSEAIAKPFGSWYNGIADKDI